MTTSKLIELADGTYVEVTVQNQSVREVSGSAADRVAASLDSVEPLMIRVCNSISSILSNVRKTVQVERMEVTIGLSFEAEGNVFITKATASANMTLTLSFRVRED